MRKDIILRLASLGYTFDTDKDGWVIGFVIDKVTNTIRNETNLSEIPEGLYQIAVDMACAEFLKAKKASGDLNGFVVDLNEVLLNKESQGDTSFSWGTDKVMSAEERLNALIEHLLNYGKPQFSAFRRLKW
ncbi:MAG: hypothetical protein FWC70_08115 [Defluviitaleaceae bacterium]|nr:hypothetical protein [Defluviitaleaceae bacterium]